MRPLPISTPQAGRIVDALKQAGQYDNTIFVVAGDNGLSLGEHGLLGKQNLYEFGGMHVPLIFAGLGIPKGETKALAYLVRPLSDPLRVGRHSRAAGAGCEEPRAGHRGPSAESARLPVHGIPRIASVPSATTAGS